MIGILHLTEVDLLNYELKEVREELGGYRRWVDTLQNELADEQSDKEKAQNETKMMGQQLADYKSQSMAGKSYDRFLQRQGMEIDRPVAELFGFKVFTDLSLPEDVILIKNKGRSVMLIELFNRDCRGEKTDT